MKAQATRVLATSGTRGSDTPEQPATVRVTAGGTGSPEELEFVGVGTCSAPAGHGGWRQTDDHAGLIGDHLPAEDSAMLAALMDADEAADLQDAQSHFGD